MSDSMDSLIAERWNEIKKKAEAEGLPTENDELVEVLESSDPDDKKFQKKVAVPLSYLTGVADAYDVTLTGLLDDTEGV